MRIAIDARPLSHPQVGGFRTYTRALVAGLAGNNSCTEILLYVDRPLPDDAPDLAGNMTVRVLAGGRLRADWGGFQRQAALDNPDLIHGTSNTLPFGLKTRSTVTVHDAMQVKRYSFVPKPKRLKSRLLNEYEAALTRLTIGKATRIITVSEYSAGEISTALNIPNDRISVVYNGLMPQPETPAEPAARTGVLALASTDPRKNIEVLFRAAAPSLNTAEPLPLKIVCTNSAAAAYVSEKALAYGVTNVEIIRGLDDAGLAQQYRHAAVFVFPSRLEGFGLPPLEAMAQGCPVVSSNAPSMPEVLGDAPLWFDPDKPDQLASMLSKLMADGRLRLQMSIRGREQAAQFTIVRMAAETEKVWQAALSK